MSTEETAHNETADLRAMVRGLQAQNKSLQARLTKTAEYLDLMLTDPSKTQGELTIIEISLDNLREEIL